MDSRRVTQPYGANPELYKPFGLDGHEGADLAAQVGANVYAAAGGSVRVVDAPPLPIDPKAKPYGIHVRLTHTIGGQTAVTVYAHLQSATVNVGDVVTAGQLIGLADATGNVRPAGAAGSHLHFGIYRVGPNGERLDAGNGFNGYLDPMPFFKTA